MPRGVAALARPAGRALTGLGRHWGLLVLLGLGITLRTLAVLAYVPAFSFPDSITYLDVAASLDPEVHRPWGYSLLLWALAKLVPFGGVVVVQHALGVLTALLVYALLQHRGVRRWVSCLAVAPMLLDAYLVQIEHYVLAESLYTTLLVGGLVLLLWHERTPWWAGAAAGLLLGYAAVTRTIGTFVLGAVAVYLLVRLLWRSISVWTALATGAAAVAVVVPYVLWFHSATGTYALTDYTGHFLYGRVSNFADCEQVDVPARLRGLCPEGDPEDRLVGEWYVWSPDSPANSGRWSEEDITEFSKTIILGQPLDYLTSTAEKTLHYFRPGHPIGQFDSCIAYWWFPNTTTPAPGACTAQLAEQGFGLDPVETRFDSDLATFLDRYQDWGSTPGPYLAVLALAGLSGLVPHRRRGPRRDALDGVACTVVALVVIGVPSATATFDYRYGLPILAVLPIGAALATRTLVARRPVDDETPAPAAETAEPNPQVPTPEAAPPA
jgi:hypothetical protein